MSMCELQQHLRLVLEQMITVLSAIDFKWVIRDQQEGAKH